MAHMRLSRPEDVPRERELWRMSFGDDWAYIDTYFDHTHNPDWAVVLEDDDGVVQTMLIGFPVALSLPGEAAIPAIYYYALGTDPAVRRRGYGRALFRFAEQTFGGAVRPVMTLLPGEPSLYNFFLTIGYEDRNFSIRQLACAADALPASSGPVRPAQADEYNALRERYLAGGAHLTFSDVYVSHQKRVARLYGGELLCVQTAGGDGCASVEYAPDGTLLVKELLVPAGQTEAALAAVIGAYPAASLLANLPNQPGFDPLGSVAPYGVTHWLDDALAQRLAGKKDVYLGLALD